ncbi:hypothetical protein JCM8547_000003 [Rhodosporidiobolus lusitaniae]
MAAARGRRTRDFVQLGGDTLLEQAFEQVPILPDRARNANAWQVGNEFVSYNIALTCKMNSLNRRQQLSDHVFDSEEVSNRIRSLIQQLRHRGKLPETEDYPERRRDLIVALLKHGPDYVLPPPAAQQLASAIPPPPVLLLPRTGPTGPTASLAPFAASRAVVENLPPNISGNLVTASAYDQHRWVERNKEWLQENGYMSLGTARPLRHAVIYGEWRRRF